MRPNKQEEAVKSGIKTVNEQEETLKLELREKEQKISELQGTLTKPPKKLKTEEYTVGGKKNSPL